MKKLLILSIILVLHGCDRNQSPYVKTKSIIKEIVVSENDEIPESLEPLSAEHKKDLNKSVQLVKGLIRKYGDPTTDQFQIERFKTLEQTFSEDSVTHVIVHVSFGLQKEAPIPKTIVDFNYLQRENNLVLKKIEIFSPTGISQDGNQPESLPNIQSADLIELSVRHESGYRNRPFQRFDYSSGDLSGKEKAQVKKLFDLINNVQIDSSFNSIDIPRTFGNPEIIVIFFKLKGSDKEWMIYNMISEEPDNPEPNAEWIFIRRFRTFVNQAETYLIKKKSNQELDQVIKELIKENKNATQQQ